MKRSPFKRRTGAKTLNQAIRKATARALARMEDQIDRPIHRFRKGEINGWTAKNLATWITPAIIRAVKRHAA